jgi:hypothetical protein
MDYATFVHVFLMNLCQVLLFSDTKLKRVQLISNFDTNVRICKSVSFLLGKIFNFPYGSKLVKDRKVERNISKIKMYSTRYRKAAVILRGCVK